MKIWIDAQLPPTLTLCLTETFDVEATVKNIQFSIVLG